MPANGKPLPVTDYGDAPFTFVHSLVQVSEFGPVTHLAFAMSQRCINEGEGERRVIARLVIPTVCLRQVIRQLANGPVSMAVSDGESAETKCVH